MTINSGCICDTLSEMSKTLSDGDYRKFSKRHFPNGKHTLPNINEILDSSGIDYCCYSVITNITDFVGPPLTYYKFNSLNNNEYLNLLHHKVGEYLESLPNYNDKIIFRHSDYSSDELFTWVKNNINSFVSFPHHLSCTKSVQNWGKLMSFKINTSSNSNAHDLTNLIKIIQPKKAQIEQEVMIKQGGCFRVIDVKHNIIELLECNDKNVVEPVTELNSEFYSVTIFE